MFPGDILSICILRYDEISADTLYQFHARYHTILYSSLREMTKPFSTPSASSNASLFTDLARLLYRSFFRIPSTRKKERVKLEKINTKELFAWKSKDALSAIYALQDRKCEEEGNGGDEEGESFADERDKKEEGKEPEVYEMSEDDENDELFNLSTDEEENVDEDGRESDIMTPDLDVLGQHFVQLSRELEALDLIYRTKDTLEEVLCEEIENRVIKRCRKVFDKPILKRATKWLYEWVYPWLSNVLPENGDADESLTVWSKRLNYHLCMMFCDLRISELFDIIIDYPDSKPAIDDLVLCVKSLDQDYRHRVVKSLHSSFQKRLLIPGAATSDILKGYISTIKCLRLLDPPGVLLEKVTGPIRDYLRTRTDTVKCLVTAWTDDQGNDPELIEELGKAEIPVPTEDAEDTAYFENDNWVPDPVDAGPNYKSSVYRSADITNLLISIFDDTEPITREIQNQMGIKLLNKTDFETETEITKLELFKLRFGETKMQHTEVMIKDIADSKRIDHYVYPEGKGRDENESALLHTTIISRLFWPTLRNEDFNVPQPIQEVMKQYEESFERYKKTRKLQWMTSLGK
ncbi:7539_t:CDS:10, partial [Paraglomus occultum]